MTRITNAMRDAIVKNALLKSGMTAKAEEIKQKRYDWAERARVETIGGHEKATEYAQINKNSRAIHDSLPSGFQGHANIIDRRQRIYINLAGACIEVRLRDYAEASSNREVIKADSPLCQQFYDIEHEYEAMVQSSDQIRIQVRATLNKFTTLKRLIEAWPEVQELLPPSVEQPKSNLPAIQVADLNKLVGLPTE